MAFCLLDLIYLVNLIVVYSFMQCWFLVTCFIASCFIVLYVFTKLFSFCFKIVNC